MIRGVHVLGQLEKLIKSIQKKWVGLGDWVDMFLKSEKPIKNRVLLFPPCSLLARPVNFSKMPLFNLDFEIRI